MAVNTLGKVSTERQWGPQARAFKISLRGQKARKYIYQGWNYSAFLHGRLVIVYFSGTKLVNDGLLRCRCQSPWECRRPEQPFIRDNSTNYLMYRHWDESHAHGPRLAPGRSGGPIKHWSGRDRHILESSRMDFMCLHFLKTQNSFIRNQSREPAINQNQHEVPIHQCKGQTPKPASSGDRSPHHAMHKNRKGSMRGPRRPEHTFLRNNSGTNFHIFPFTGCGRKLPWEDKGRKMSSPRTMSYALIQIGLNRKLPCEDKGPGKPSIWTITQFGQWTILESKLPRKGWRPAHAFTGGKPKIL